MSMGHFSVVLGIEAVSDDNGALTMLFLEFNLLSNQSSISVVHYANSIIKSMTKIDEQSLAIANSGQSLSGMYFGHKEEVTMHWTAPLQMVYDFNEATDHSAMGRIDGLSVAAAGNFIYVGHTMGLITYAFGKLNYITKYRLLSALHILGLEYTFSGYFSR